MTPNNTTASTILSVIISVYNAETPDHFDRAIKSIWTDQKLNPDEVVLVEDGPLTDELLSLIDKWKAEIGGRLVIVVNESNLGLTKSLNKALEVASGDLIARMDTDDISMPDRFLLQKEYLCDHPEIGVVGTGIQEINDEGKFLDLRMYPEDTPKIRKYIAKANPIAHPTVMFRRSALGEVRYDERYRKNQDLKLWFDLLVNGCEFHNLPVALLQFRRNMDTYAKRSNKISLRSELEIYLDGISRLHGKWSMKKVYPWVRFLVKSMPNGFYRFVYKFLFKKNNL